MMASIKGVSTELPPNLFDTTTLVSLFATLAILFLAYGASLAVLDRKTPASLRVLFIWHAFDAGIHFILEGSFLYHCFFSSLPTADLTLSQLRTASFYPTAPGFPFGSTSVMPGGEGELIYGAQAGGDNPFAQLWMVYARADKRWAGADLTVISLELLTVFGAGPASVLVCWLLGKGDRRVYLVMVMLATAELYGGFMTFCPEWLTGSQYLDTSNFMYLWVYLVFFNGLWVALPIYAIHVSWKAVMAAFNAETVVVVAKKKR